MRHIVSILLENQTGALSRIVGLFSQRGYNIETITAAPTEDKDITRLNIVTYGDAVHIEHITKQLDRFLKAVTELTDVIETVRSGVCGISRGEHALRS